MLKDKNLRLGRHAYFWQERVEISIRRRSVSEASRTTIDRRPDPCITPVGVNLVTIRPPRVDRDAVRRPRHDQPWANEWNAFGILP